MASWQTIERFDIDNSIWILKYDLFQLDRQYVPKGTPGAEKFTSCHGWYDNEADALKVLHHFPKPNTYRIEKVHQRKLKA